MPDAKLTPVSSQATEKTSKTPNRTSLAYHAPLLKGVVSDRGRSSRNRSQLSEVLNCQFSAGGVSTVVYHRFSRRSHTLFEVLGGVVEKNDVALSAVSCLVHHLDLQACQLVWLLLEHLRLR